MSTNGALGPEASKFLSVVFKHVKAAGMFSMRHSHQDTDSTWNTKWFSTLWRQRISSRVTATNAAFVNRILQRDSVFQQDGPSTAKASPHPRFYNYDPKLNRRSCNRRIPHLTRDKASLLQHRFLSDLLSAFFPSFFFLYHTSAKKNSKGILVSSLGGISRIYMGKYVRGLSAISRAFCPFRLSKTHKTLRAIDKGFRSSLKPRQRRQALKIKQC